MFRYLAFVWHDDDAAARVTAHRFIERHSSHLPDWQVAFRRKGIFVGYAGTRVGSSEPHYLGRDGGVVLGKLFERSPNSGSVAAPTTLDESKTRSIRSSRGRDLVDRYWGRYVAFLHDEVQETSWVLRDPAAGLPCLTLRVDGVSVFFSRMRDVQHLGLDSFEVNWKHLAAWVCMLKGPTRSTALCQVTQVLGGECVQLCEGRVTRAFYWDPLEIANSDIIEDPAEATQALRECVMDAVRAWASCYSGIALSLSGGLDSSIIYAALRDSPAKAKLTCFHHYPLGSDLDERHFARLVAQSGGSPLIERPRSPQVSLELLRDIEVSHEPTQYLYYLEHSRLDARLAAEHSATATFTGWGGDQIFYQNHARFAAGDYLHYSGLRPRLLRIAIDSARMDRVSVWRVLGSAFAEHLEQRRWSFHEDIAPSMTLIRPEVTEEVFGTATHLHPLFHDFRGTPSGKIWHAIQLINPWEFYDPLGGEGDPEPVTPLHSQPVLELALRLPIHVLTLGGWDRAIARRAFYQELPREVANRTNKGGIEQHVRTILENNIAYVREMLLDGALVREGIVDKKQLTTALSGEASTVQASSVALFDFIATEAWLRCWRNQDWRAAA